MRPDTASETQHRLWLEQPITKQLRRILDDHRETVVKAVATESAQTNEESDRRLRQLAVQLKTIDTLTTLIYDTESYIARTR